MSAAPRKRVAVLLSGRGSNMAALLDAAKDPAYPAEIAAVLSNRPDAGGLDTARAAGIEAVAIDHKLFASRAAHEAAVAAELTRIAPDIVCLAGYMRLLSQDFTDRFRGRMINIHPSLLPLFPGLHTHERVLAAGMRVHGCTVHFVTEVMDEGPIIAQAAIAVLPGDTPDALAARLIRAEHRLYAEALRLVASGRARMSGDRAVLSAPETQSGPGDILLASDAGRIVAL
ncbi:phosphoribosylglycinamide formyltransferase [Antarcticirhabdus aurantiaca]|uniref:Phosphoribosylglycinamide formyltransferase n=1 Tax=Antarcticirhabdus aurantiaca TaxID=2606717 RepID=A0ACD4NUQ1_9HYPH|nr:phosphoribosylglycinamide formyltransferase [Antarcticirhabdus aurantiaca]WAJ30468.1 phosphoribosylglycinamide formyltransferase [Jeongeuplla avenae]